MRMLKRIWSHLRVLAKARRNRTDLLRWLWRRPQLFVGVGVYEMALLMSSRADSKLKQLAVSKAAAMVNCEFCLDIGAELGRRDGVTEQQILDLPRYLDSDAYTELEKLVISFAEEMSKTAIVPDGLREQLLQYLTMGQLAEIAAEVAWEHQRARLNQALGVSPDAYTDLEKLVMGSPTARPA